MDWLFFFRGGGTECSVKVPFRALYNRVSVYPCSFSSERVTGQCAVEILLLGPFFWAGPVTGVQFETLLHSFWWRPGSDRLKLHSVGFAALFSVPLWLFLGFNFKATLDEARSISTMLWPAPWLPGDPCNEPLLAPPPRAQGTGPPVPYVPHEWPPPAGPWPGWARDRRRRSAPAIMTVAEGPRVPVYCMDCQMWQRSTRQYEAHLKDKYHRRRARTRGPRRRRPKSCPARLPGAVSSAANAANA